MTITKNAIGFDFSEDQTELIQQKIGRIKYGEELIETLVIKVKLDKSYKFDASVNFHWGLSAHVDSEDYDFAAALNKLMDILDQKIKKEKDKIQDHKK